MTFRIFLAAFISLVIAAPAAAHPHVWVTMTQRAHVRARRHRHRHPPALGLRRHVLGLRPAGNRSKEKGKFTREELAPLAKVNVELLKEYDYFTYATADGKKTPLAEPAPDYWLDYKDEVLTLNFTLPLKTAGEGEGAQDRNLRSDHLHRFRVGQG